MDEAIKMFKSGMYVKDIAAALGVNPIALGKKLREVGLCPKSNASTKSNHPRWNGGRSISWSGYVRILMRDHPRALSNGYVWEHILVAEKKLGRPLAYFGKGDARNEVIHHINGDKLDNTPENLEILSPSEHLKVEWSENPLKFPQSKTSQKSTPKRYKDWQSKNKTSK